MLHSSSSPILINFPEPEECARGSFTILCLCSNNAFFLLLGSSVKSFLFSRNEMTMKAFKDWKHESNTEACEFSSPSDWLWFQETTGWEDSNLLKGRMERQDRHDVKMEHRLRIIWREKGTWTRGEKNEWIIIAMSLSSPFWRWEFSCVLLQVMFGAAAAADEEKNRILSMQSEESSSNLSLLVFISIFKHRLLQLMIIQSEIIKSGKTVKKSLKATKGISPTEWNSASGWMDPSISPGQQRRKIPSLSVICVDSLLQTSISLSLSLAHLSTLYPKELPPAFLQVPFSLSWSPSSCSPSMTNAYLPIVQSSLLLMNPKFVLSG